VASTVAPLRPELIIGLVGAVGTDLKLVSGELQSALQETIGYSSLEISISSLLDEMPVWKSGAPPKKNGPEDVRLDEYMNAGNEARRKSERPDILVLAALKRIAAARKDITSKIAAPGEKTTVKCKICNSTVEVELEFGQNQPQAREFAFILRSLKHPEEVFALQKLYGPGFLLLAVSSSEESRRQNLRDDIVKSRASDQPLPNDELDKKVEYLMKRDDFERDPGAGSYGQQVRETFYLADVFVDVDDQNWKKELARFVKLIFGYPYHTPKRDEFGMFIAHAAATRSLSLSRQVGAAIASASGEAIALGANEVAKRGGGQVWEDDPRDQRDRDFEREEDTNYKTKIQNLEVSLKEAFSLVEGGNDFLEKMLKVGSVSVLFKATPLMDMIEFHREVHAEMAAVIDAAMRGVNVKGCTLYTTTFPCHDCAKHILAAGIARVVYVEPYVKSKASDFYPEAFNGGSNFIKPFVGVGPRRYRDVFTLTSGEGAKIDRKGKDGKIVQWDGRSASYRWRTWAASFLEMEKVYLEQLGKALEKLKT
jgi:deoxycytidylate deaminase